MLWQVRGEDLRVRRMDVRRKTCQRYFTANHTYMPKDGSEEEVITRYAELLGIFSIELEGRSFMLLEARWFQKSWVDLETQTPRLRKDLGWDPTREVLIEARHIGNMVSLITVPHIPMEYVVLDRHFDTLLFPEP